MIRFSTAVLSLLAFQSLAIADTLPENWTLSLETPGGPLPVEIELTEHADKINAWLINGEERIAVEASRTGSELVLDLPHYDSRIELSEDKSTGEPEFSGTWTKRRGPDKVAKVACNLRERANPEFDSPAPFLGRWSVDFEESDDLAVGNFRQGKNNQVHGTFLTTTGDYRYLTGGVKDGQLTLSCFDGAHAFLFKASLSGNDSVAGTFYSGNWYQEKWEARNDSSAELPNAFQQTSVIDAVRLGDLEFPDVDGKKWNLRDKEFQGKLLLVEVFGTWCPNCHDEAAYLAELREKYGDSGLKVLGLAFELTGKFDRDAKQVKRYCARFNIDYPVLIAGTADKAEASERFPVLDRIRSYPTTLFIDSTGTIRAVYTGFSGPATGEAHAKLRQGFETIIERVLNEQ